MGCTQSSVMLGAQLQMSMDSHHVSVMGNHGHVVSEGDLSNGEPFGHFPRGG